MELLSYDTHACVMCGHRGAVAHYSARFRFCDGTCHWTGGGFVDTRTYGGGQKRPHLHRTCTRCGYEWLTEIAHASETAKASSA